MRLMSEFLPVLVWLVVWTAGGVLLAASLFRLRRGETALVGFAIGLVLEIWFANLIARAFSILLASWASAVLVVAAGVAAAVLARRCRPIAFSWRQWGLLAVCVVLFTLIGRGLGIFDDYQNLPTISLMATGDIPPHFALNPSLNFGYHYFLLLFSAQLMRLGGMFPWTALDVARGLMLGLPLVLGGLWGYRLARNQVVAGLTGAMLAFAGGARWLLLLLPAPWLAAISDNIKLIGSASTSAPNLAEAMLTNWKIDGAGPIPFPFAFYTGINQPYIMAYTGIAGTGILILLLLLLIANRSRHWSAALVVCGLLASLAMANEIAFLLLAFGTFVVVLVWMVRNRSWRLPTSLAIWLGIFFASTLIAAVQGGLLTEALRSRLLSAYGQTSYFDTSLNLIWPPAIVSAHLGSLSLANPAQLDAALAEIGPVVLVTPLELVWAFKSLLAEKWYESSFIAASAASLVAVFIQFKGPLFTAWPRLMSGWFLSCILYSVPLLWIWVRGRSGGLQAAVVGGGVITCLSGLVLLSIQLVAVQRPVFATFITPLDAKMSQEYWNRLEPGALVFDPVVYRAPTIFGRFTDSSPSWYTRDPRWEALASAPDPQAIRAAGFHYMYFDKDYWDKLTPAQQSAFLAACVKQVAQVDGIHSEQNYAKDFRRLLDIQNCR